MPHTWHVEPPTEAELRERIAAVRDGWSADVERRRRAYNEPEWTPPVCDSSELRRAVGEEYLE